MGHLIIFAHPNPKSFNAAIKDELVACLKSQGKEVVVRDLYQIGFNPILSGQDFTQFLKGEVPSDIAQEQDFVRKADVVTFIYPVWWFNMPAILRGYIDRVFSRGFAYDFVGKEIKGLLTGKRVQLINTTGGSQEAYEQFGFGDAIKTGVDNGIFAFCGMTVVSHKYFYAVPTVSDQDRKKMLAEVKSLAL